jgi:hypothetical protein
MGALLLLSLVVFDRGLREPVPLPRLAVAAAEEVQEWCLASSYGLFRDMTRDRPEIVMEGSDDGVDWKPYAFQWKPGDPARAPAFLQPHMPRLDWLMWFAALQRRAGPLWFLRLEKGLLEGSPAVLDLLDTNPFPDRPPRYVRSTLYAYRFTTPEERAATGAWWHREVAGVYAPPARR